MEHLSKSEHFVKSRANTSTSPLTADKGSIVYCDDIKTYKHIQSTGINCKDCPRFGGEVLPGTKESEPAGIICNPQNKQSVTEQMEELRKKLST